jgi:hypothetical protein
MATNARIPKVDRTNPLLLKACRLMAEMADALCEDPTDFWCRSKAARKVMADIMWEDEQQRLEAAVTTDPVVEVDGEAYRSLPKQASSALLHGLWGAHRVREPLYRLIGVRNGPTVKPLLRKLGAVDGSLLPDLADEAGELLSKMTSREVEETLDKQGFRPPSRTTLVDRLGGLMADMSTTARELEQECREHEELDFELGVVSCGLDRFAARMDETLPDGPERDRKLARRRPAAEYDRTPPEPYTSNYRMAWAANVTLYDTQGHARRSFRYGADAGHDVQTLVARVVDDVLHLCSGRQDVPVACIQDGASDLEALRSELRERLPEGVARRNVVDFHHAVAYLDAVVTARGDGDPDNLAGWYRLKLLTDDNGASDIVNHLRRCVANLDEDTDIKLTDALDAALTYFEKRRPLMKYAEARADHVPIGSGATESTCGLLQLRVKHPGSHWRPKGLRGTLAARAFALSGRWTSAFRVHHTGLVAQVRAP